jgi:type IV secretory pathway VirJ component
MTMQTFPSRVCIVMLAMVIVMTNISAFAAVPVVEPIQAILPGQLTFGAFGYIAVIRPIGAPTSVALFLSGDGGWDSGVIDMATALSKTGALVLGINTPAYIKNSDAVPDETCHSAAIDLQMMSQYAQQRLGFKDYIEPVLVGYSSGATLAYIGASQSPASFRGAISLSFGTNLYNKKPYCANVGLKSRPDTNQPGHIVEPSTSIDTPWVVLQGAQDQVINPELARKFVAQTHGAALIMLPKVGHSYTNYANWWPQFEHAYRTISSTASREHRGTLGADGFTNAVLKDLPLVSVTNPAAKNTDSFAILLSGDGGWADFDQKLAQVFAAHGVPVVGWSTLKYFWSAKTPAQASADLSRVIAYYSKAWGKSKVALIGFSFGADTLPFMVNGLPQAQQSQVGAIAMMGAGTTAKFEFSTLDWFNARKSGLATLPEIIKLEDSKTLCIFGVDDKSSVCPTLPKGQAEGVELPGGHHLGGAYANITRPVLAKLGVQ